MTIAGTAIVGPIKLAALDAVGDRVISIVWRATKVVRALINHMAWIEASESVELGGMTDTQAARASLHYTISDEETIYSAISLPLRGAEMPAKINYQRTTRNMLTLDCAEFGRINLGGRCWYLSRVWGLMCLAPPVTSKRCKKKFFDFVSRCEDEMVGSFVEWITSPHFSRQEFLHCMQTFLHSLPPPLWDIVYGYLAAPSADLVRQKILSLI